MAIEAAAAGQAGLGMIPNILASIFGMKAQTKALRQGMGTLREGYEAAGEQVMPWREAGAQALEQLTQMTFAGPGEITEDPGYQFEVEQGMKGLQRYASARGQLGSGAQKKRIVEFGQGLASTRVRDFLDRYRQRLGDFRSLSETGFSAAGQIAGQEERGAQTIADYQTGIGRVRASGYAGIAGAAKTGLRDYYKAAAAGQGGN